MNREGVIIIICIGIVVLFYLFQENTAPEEQVDLAKETTVQSSEGIAKEELKQVLKEVNSAMPDSLDNK